MTIESLRMVRNALLPAALLTLLGGCAADGRLQPGAQAAAAPLTGPAALKAVLAGNGAALVPQGGRTIPTSDVATVAVGTPASMGQVPAPLVQMAQADLSRGVDGAAMPGTPARGMPASANGYATAPTASQNAQVSDLISKLRSKAGVEAPSPGPALVAPGGSQAPGGYRRPVGATGLDGVTANIPPPPTTTVTLAAPGMILPDPRVQDAIGRRRAGTQQPTDVRETDGLF